VLALLLAIGLMGTGGHLLLILAFTQAPASRLAPLLYVQIGAAVLLGWAVLGERPDAWAWLGMAVIAACGAASAALNLRVAGARREHSPMAADTVAE
jgi:drug/metabolite transporter (DMT)-like permease